MSSRAGEALVAVVVDAALAFLLLFRLRWSVLKTLGASALVGGVIHLPPPEDDLEARETT